MDKFGIFNILNSLLSSKSDNTAQNPPTSTDANNLLSSLLSPKKQEEPPKKPQPTSFAPIQSSMLSTMNSHDEFIKRVMTKNDKK